MNVTKDATLEQDSGLNEATRRIQQAADSKAPSIDLSGLGLRVVPETVGQLANLQSLDLHNNQITVIPEALRHLAKLQDLYLYINQITIIPEALGHLAKLQRLSLSNNQITAIPEALGQLANLLSLNLHNNQITAIPEALGQLANLQELYLNNNQITAIPEALGQLANLQELYLNNNQITVIPEALGQLANLLSLVLNRNQITVIPEALGKLVKLQELYLSFNQITAIPEALGQLANLQSLNLSGNQLTIIPEALGQLANLQSLGLNRNQITVIPEALGQLANLQSLYLSFNQITTIPETLGQLANLQELVLNDNRITAIPDILGQVTNLQSLNLSDNQITTIPEALGQLPKLTELLLHNNPSLGIPDEILGPTRNDVLHSDKNPKPPSEILSYFKNLIDASPLNEAKLIMVGPGMVGKTSLVKTLKTGKFNSREKTTEGIKIDDWRCPVDGKDEVTIHIWDFGGQEMMHATHQFFLTTRSLYLLVLNRRVGGCDREADYWFRLIRAFGGKDAPVIVVLNKQKSEAFDVNRGDWLEKYADNIRGFVATDCTDEKSIAELRAKIQEELQRLDSLKTRFPRRWFAIKNELSQMRSEYLTFEDYRALCTKYGEPDPKKQTELAGFLHELGIALNYKDDPRLRYAYVLKPEWVTGGVYALLHAFAASKGIFKLAEGQRVLKEKGYSIDAADFILGLMEQFELGFPLRDAQQRVMIPQLLEDQQPDDARAFKPAECLNFGYQYAVVPEGLLPRFIVRTHHLSKAEDRWKSGVILHDRTGACQALVRANSTENQVRIHVSGQEALRREMLAIIRHNFDAIHADYESGPDDLVYPAEAPEKPLSRKELESFVRSGTTFHPVMLANGNVAYVNLLSLLEPVKPSLEPLKIFLSYAHKDEKYLTELRKDLKLMERDGLARVWSDRELMPGEKWEPRILEELKQADVVLCQLSRDFLSSDFCVLTELDTAIERKAAGSAELIAYILKDCGWQEVPKLKQFQMLPRGLKSLSDWKNKDAYWRDIAEGIRETLEKLQKAKTAQAARQLH
jgi:small GTP-binding protein